MDVYIEPILPQPGELLIVGHGRIAEVLANIAPLEWIFRSRSMIRQRTANRFPTPII